jgi:hypothetical protein
MRLKWLGQKYRQKFLEFYQIHVYEQMNHKLQGDPISPAQYRQKNLRNVMIVS